MTSKPMVDHGQTLTAPAGKVIGFLDGKVELEAFADALSAAGYPAKIITTLCGKDGIHLLERLKEHSFFFGDSEDSIIELSIRQLEQGHYAVAIEVTDHQQAVELASLAAPHGGHSFTYFGTWVTQQLPT
jgi:hypothetical protein